MEILISIIGKIVEYTVEPVFRELGYLCFINSNFQKLKDRVEKLKDTRESVQHMVHNARRNAEDIKPEVETWLSEVDDIIRKSEAILVNEGQLDGLCSNLVRRHNLSRKASKLADEVLEMKKEGNFDKVSNNLHGPLVGSSLPKIIDFLDFESRKSIMEQIMDALFDDDVNRIGVYGMGGVGKTMLVKEILRKIMEEKSFDEVVISTFSQTPDLKNIQGQLADRLGLKLEQETIEGRAFKLQKRLKMEKSILVVFDDIWEYIDLETIGIPNVVDHKGCKILFTSRDKHLLSNEMWVNKTFEIKVLKKEESWDLFKTMVGEIVEDLKPTANQIAMECASLPIAITTVAKALRNKPSPIWKDALDQLKNSMAVKIRGMDNKVYSSLKLSYDYLECEEVKLLFLLCSMFPEDFEINVKDLQVYAMGMGFLHGVDTVAQGRRRITKLVNDLISSSLLLQNESKDNHVRMHDLVRDVAIMIASKNDKIRTLNYVQRENKEWEEEELLGNHTAVYLDVQGLPMKLMLHKVHLLRIDVQRLVKCNLVETLFEEMKELKGVELRGVQISLFPPSLYSNIRLLHLLNCELGTIDMIGELKKLEILSFKGSNIVQIPTTISQLRQLKVLDLSFCEHLKVIPPNILSRLTKLEELYLETFEGWEREEWYEGRKNASLSELKYLSHLYALHLTIQDEKIMPKQLFSTELDLEKFDITIGWPRQIRFLFTISYHSKSTYSMKRTSRILFLKVESECGLDDSIKLLLKRSEKLYLLGSICRMVLHLELDENDSSHLKHLLLVNNEEIQHFIHKQNKSLRKILSNLEYLGMHNLKNLESMIHGYVKESPFNNLRIVNVHHCNKLGTLFFNCILDDVLNLEVIDISFCKMVEEIIVMENKETTDQIEFTHLKYLQLYVLPQLQHFCSKIEKIGQLSLDGSEKIETSTIINDDSFFSEQVSLPNLEYLRIDGADNLKMIWHNIRIPNSFSKLKDVEIGSCNSLQKVFPSNIINMLTCLNILKIKDCNLLEGIFEVQGLNDIEKSVKLPNLRYLELFNLPNLEYVWNKDPCELLIFEDLSIHKCPKLKRSYPVKLLHQLGRLEIDFGGLIDILEKEKTVHMFESTQFETSKVKTTEMQDGPELFSKLKFLKLFGSFDYNLIELPMEVVRILHNQLEEFEVRRTFIEEIFSNERLVNNAASMPLRRLELLELPKLKHLWKETSQKINISSLENLLDLTISRCSQLNTLIPSSMSFTRLIHLKVEECHRLTHLLDPSVVRGLVQLSFLSLKKCKRMITVIAEGASEEGNDDIVFNKLRHLRLEDFSKLTSFYSGKSVIRFPHLGSVMVKDCPEMKVFSLGIVSTPDLATRNIRFSGSYNNPTAPELNSEEIIVKDINVIFRQIWEDNLDANIQYLFAEENLEENQSDPSSSSHVEEQQELY